MGIWHRSSSRLLSIEFNHPRVHLLLGPLFKHIINELEQKRKKPDSEKIIQFYAGHDANIIALLDSMGMWDGGLASFCSTLFFELRELNNDYIITVSEKEKLKKCEVVKRREEAFNLLLFASYGHIRTRRIEKVVDE